MLVDYIYDVDSFGTRLSTDSFDMTSFSMTSVYRDSRDASWMIVEGRGYESSEVKVIDYELLFNRVVSKKKSSRTGKMTRDDKQFVI